MQNFRMPGEFEPQSSVLIGWPGEEYSAAGYQIQNVSIEVIKNLVGCVTVYVNCVEEELVSDAKAKLTDAGVDIAKLNFTVIPDEVVYFPRDYGADILVSGGGERQLANFPFSCYGEMEKGAAECSLGDAFAIRHAEVLGVEDVVHSDLATEGGDHEFNGKGTLMTIKRTEVDKRNPEKTGKEVEEELKRMFRVTNILWIPDGTYDDEFAGTDALWEQDGQPVLRSAAAGGHVDEMAKFVNANTILLAEVTEEEAKHSKLHAENKKRLDAAYEAIKEARDQDGNPFQIVRIAMPEPIVITAYPGDCIRELWEYNFDENAGRCLRDGTPVPEGELLLVPAMSYCNFLICNEVVLGQKYWKEGMPEIIREKDKKAEQVLKSVFPERRIVMIDTIALNIQGGGIHCHTKNVPACG